MNTASIIEKLDFLRENDVKRECAHCGHILTFEPPPCPNCQADTGQVTWEVFGAAKHQYRLNPCLTEDDVKRFEEAHGVHLPDEYCWFLLNLGNGGAGPHYGLYPLSIGGANPEAELGDQDLRHTLSKSFPHTEHWNASDSAWPVNDPEAFRRFEDWYCADEHVFGTLPICGRGCGQVVLLVVTGGERDHLWLDDRTNDGGIGPILESGQRQCFLDWYLRWLDESVMQLKDRPAP